MYALTRILQSQVGIATLSDNFGPGTLSALQTKYPLINAATPQNVMKTIQAALYCKGYEGGNITGKYADSETGLNKLKSEMGFGTTTGGVGLAPKMVKELMTMDPYVLLAGGDPNARAVQQWLNGSYINRSDFYIVPCDGYFSRDVQRALMLAIQYQIGMADGVANGVFGPGTQAGIKSNPVSTGSSGTWVRLFTAALIFNRRPGATFTSTYSSSTASIVSTFQKFIKLPVTGFGDFQTWASLLISTGDPNRPGAACDCVTEITPSRARQTYSLCHSVLYPMGYKTARRDRWGVTEWSPSSDQARLLTGDWQQRYLRRPRAPAMATIRLLFLRRRIHCGELQGVRMNRTKLIYGVVLGLVILISVGSLFFAPRILAALNLEAEPVATVSSAIAAVGGAIAAVAALMAARESSSSARDSARAVAFAQKPIVRIAMKPSEKDATGWMDVEIENLSQHLVTKGTLRWTLRDGRHGVMDIPPIEARTRPYGGMVHDSERVMTIPIGTFDDALAGADRLSFEFFGISQIVRWKLSQEAIYEVNTNSGLVHERYDRWMPAPQRVSVSQTEVEV